MEDARPHYVNNAEFYAEMVKFRALCKETPEGKRARVPESVGRKIMLICERLSYSRDFVGSPHREEMVLDAIENCILYIQNFDPEKSKNPFAYFTQIAYFAFIRRSQRERKSVHTRYEYARQVGISEIIDHANVDGGEAHAEFAQHLSNYLSFGHEPASKEPPKEPRKTRTTLAHQKKLKDREEAAARLADAELIDGALPGILGELTGADELPLVAELRLETAPDPLSGLDSMDDGDDE